MRNKDTARTLLLQKKPHEGLSTNDKVKVTLEVYDHRVGDNAGWQLPAEEYFSDGFNEFYERQYGVITLCGHSTVASLWPLLFSTVIVVESNKVFISPASSKCYSKCARLKVKGKRLSFTDINILCRQNIASTELVERCRVKVFPSLRNFMMIVN